MQGLGSPMCTLLVPLDNAPFPRIFWRVSDSFALGENYSRSLTEVLKVSGFYPLSNPELTERPSLAVLLEESRRRNLSEHGQGERFLFPGLEKAEVLGILFLSRRYTQVTSTDEHRHGRFRERPPRSS